MKIAIHHTPGSFSDKWIEYCDKNKIDYKLVNCYKSDIIEQLKNCGGLMWHWSQVDSRAILFARQLTMTLEHSGIKVFPNTKTSWHFDDKLGQKYLFEVLNVPFVNSYVFYYKKEAQEWARQTSYPKVFKLRGGAGSVNVKLIHSKSQALRMIRKAFGKGFWVIDRRNSLNDRFIKLRREKNLHSVIHVIKGFIRLIYPSYDVAIRPKDKGYIYFQDFIPGNDHDIRVIVIGNRAFAIKRVVRKNDFRASGSGNIIHRKEEIPIECVRSAFEWAEKLNTQCIGFDFVFDSKKMYILEISYGFVHQVYVPCPGFWDKELNWHDGQFTPQFFMIEDFITDLAT